MQDPGVVLPYISYISMCRGIGYAFLGPILKWGLICAPVEIVFQV